MVKFWTSWNEKRKLSVNNAREALLAGPSSGGSTSGLPLAAVGYAGGIPDTRVEADQDQVVGVAQAACGLPLCGLPL